MKATTAKKIVASLVLVTAINPFGAICNAGMYGTLEKTAHGWQFSKIHTGMPSSYAVDLDTRSPVHYDTREYDCTTTLWNHLSNTCKENDGPFRTHSTHYLKSTFNNLLGTIFLSPLFFGFITMKTAYFAQEDFDAAVTSAYASDNIEELVRDYKTYMQYSQAKAAEFNTVAESKLSAVYNKHTQAEQDFVNSVKVSYKIVDESGFWHSDFELPKLNITLSALSARTLHIAPNFSLSTEPADFQKELKTVKDNFDQELLEKMTLLNTTVADYDLELSKNSRNLNLPSSTEMKRAGFRIRSDYSILKGTTPNVEVVYTIQSKDFDQVYPRFANSDDNLDVMFDGHTLTAINKKDKFMQINSISIYYNGEVYNTNAALELPPETRKEYNPFQLLNAENIKKESMYTSANKQNTKNRTVSFGFAIKYRTADQTVDKTLYAAPKYNVYKMLSELL